MRRDARERLSDVGVSTSGSSLGAPGTEAVTRLVVARWPRARIVRGAADLEDGPEATGVFARFTRDGDTLELLDEQGEDRAARRSAATAWGSCSPSSRAPTSSSGSSRRSTTRASQAGVRALDERKLRNAFAVAATGDRVEKLPLVGR